MQPESVPDECISPSFSRSDEVRLFRLVRLGEAARQCLSGEQLPPLRHKRMERRVRTGETAHDQLVVGNLGLVGYVVGKVWSTTDSADDLMQEGAIGLMRAIEKFDYRRGHRFSTYAMWWIRQAVNRAVAKDSLIRMPVGQYEKIGQYLRARNYLEKQGSGTTPETIAKHIGLSLAKVRQLEQQSKQRTLKSLDEPLDGDEGNRSLQDVLQADSAFEPQYQFAKRQRRYYLEQAMGNLPARERQILMWRVGWDGEPPRRLQEIADIFGISKERVRQIEQKSLRVLHQIFQRDIQRMSTKTNVSYNDVRAAIRY